MSIVNELTRIKQAKENIKTSLRNKGSVVDDNELIGSYAKKIDDLPSPFLDGMLISDEGAVGVNHLVVTEENPGADVIIPEKINGKTVKGFNLKLTAWMNPNPYYNGAPLSSVKSLTLPSTCESVGTEVFKNAKNLVKFSGPGVKNIEDNAFFVCTKLTDVEFAASGLKIGREAFYSSGLTTFDFAAIDECDARAFRNTKITTCDLTGSNLTIIPSGFMGYTKTLTELKLHPLTTKIGKEAFAGTLITEVFIPDTVIQIESLAFADTNITSVELPADCTYAKNSFPEGCIVTRRA